MGRELETIKSSILFFFLSKNKFRAVKTVKENIKIVIITVSLLFEKVKKIVNMLKNDIKE